ncbi:glycerophosphoryl diester phosphodiesterase [Chishuiella changwenlii]|uniref:Glycerophosphoryl diester phosphodiesterase n=1 Tax=Chishuiella changwenlii TaxID=1434701 RepID=A0A1M6ZCG1_9FLAO|nr:glycerophosphodiester phosphodiesterase family protein [Chishuiella changwenlii]GGE86484.1 glycerophosphoryl diester phosphodiesterase [Chishuiella changwenlii]SHL28044.1 glycerophosphoryl diester phosphodiesterase [Chishuiella changwenlii]
MPYKYIKKYCSKILIVGLLVIYSCSPKNNSIRTVSEQSSDIPQLKYSTKNENYVSAHRGGSGIKNYPENCIETFDYLFKNGIQIFEIDVAETKEGNLVLMHDNSLQRTSTGRQDVNQVTLNQLKEYFLVDDFGNKTSFKIPTFKEALKWGKNKPIYFMVDIKKGVDYNDIIKEIKETTMQNQVVLVTYTIGQAKKMHQLAPNMLLSVSMRNEREFNEMINSGIAKDKMVAFTGTKRNDPSLLKKIHEENILVIFGTLGNLDKSSAAKNGQLYRDLEKDGVDIFATDRAIFVHQTINKN